MALHINEAFRGLLASLSLKEPADAASGFASELVCEAVHPLSPNHFSDPEIRSRFTSLHAGGPEPLVADQVRVIDGIFKQLAAAHSELAKVGCSACQTGNSA